MCLGKSKSISFAQQTQLVVKRSIGFICCLESNLLFSHFYRYFFPRPISYDDNNDDDDGSGCQIPRLSNQWFLTIFDSRHPSLVIEQFGGTANYNLLVNICQAHKLAALRLRTTDLNCLRVVS